MCVFGAKRGNVCTRLARGRHIKSSSRDDQSDVAGGHVNFYAISRHRVLSHPAQTLRMALRLVRRRAVLISRVHVVRWMSLHISDAHQKLVNRKTGRVRVCYRH